ncbi:hypothetical protein B0H65DRAFT_78034 [Neurospora tetraspora]|uniref:Secreted protein n=1 Tax=Neurospora tetraspora TaxID=94610 RepID=A0AAE0J187_9PEZI|nr:hypothetical protein B0H65DRAFT_78034 [Neurospora tetraspora]
MTFAMMHHFVVPFCVLFCYDFLSPTSCHFSSSFPLSQHDSQKPYFTCNQKHEAIPTFTFISNLQPPITTPCLRPSLRPHHPVRAPTLPPSLLSSKSIQCTLSSCRRYGLMQSAIAPIREVMVPHRRCDFAMQHHDTVRRTVKSSMGK